MLVTPVGGEGELSLEQLGQIFHDMNVLSTPVGKGQAVDLDRSDLYIQTANEVAKLPVIKAHGGCDTRAMSISKKSGVWTTKTILLKSVRAAAEGPGSHVDHIRDTLPDPFLKDKQRMSEIVDRFEHALTVITDHTDVPREHTLMRTATWWVAIGLILHDLHQNYEEGRISPERQDAFLAKIAKIDWSLGNPEFSFLGQTAEEKDGSTPVDGQGRPVINRFFGGSKAYYNLAALIRRMIGLRETVPSYGSDYGASLKFKADGTAIAAE